MTMHAPVRNRGSVFVMTLAIIIVLTSLAMVIARTMRVEAASSANYAAQLQAEAVAQGAIEYVKTVLANHDGSQVDESAILCEAVAVGKGYFWIIRPNTLDSSTQAYGLVDEEGKFNINAVELEDLARLPGMTTELAAGIVDWRDDNEEVESGGAESAYYASLTPAYQSKNDLFETIDELLMVKDITPAILYGEDVNRNGLLDDNENDADESLPDDNRDGQLDYGLATFVTVYHSQQVLDAQGQTRVNVNTGNQLRSVLEEAVEPSRVDQMMDDVRRGRPFVNLIDFYYRIGLQPTEFEKIEDRLTPGPELVRAQVNFNTAPRQVLMAMPGLLETDADAIIDRRTSGEPFENLTDIIELLPREKAIAVGGLAGFKSYHYSADIVAVDGSGRAFKRWWVVFDAQGAVQVRYVRDMTHLGWPLDQAILENLRAGRSPDGNDAGMNMLTSGVR